MKLQRPPATLTAMKINEGYKSFSLQQQAKTRSSLGQSVDWDYITWMEEAGSAGGTKERIAIAFYSLDLSRLPLHLVDTSIACNCVRFA